MFSKIIITCAFLITMTKCDMYLKLEMQSFNNPHGITHDLKPCFNATTTQQKCLTYFKFCLSASSSSSHECLSEFKTQIIGEDMITNEQFKLTTNSIVFPIIGDEQSLKQLNLFVEVYNHQQEQESQLISEWKLDNIVLKGKVNEWRKFTQVNEQLSQQMTFSYKLECFNNYEGSYCQKPVCSSGCNTVNGGGFCVKPNECLCKPGWSGENCDQKSTLTVESTKCDLDCKNGGKCQINLNGVASCKCEANIFKGELCQIKVIVDTCSSDHCLNGGSCLANGECLCPPGYAGQRCQIKRLTSQCGMVTCYNGGTCFIDNQNEYACMCHHVFTGKFCETKLVETTTTTQASILESVVGTTTTTNTILKQIILNSESNIHVANKSDFSLQEIFLIVMAGVGMPVFSILIVVLLYRINSNRKTNENLKQFQNDNSRMGKTAVENIYVECNNKNNTHKEITCSNAVIDKQDKLKIDSLSNCKYNVTQSHTNEKMSDDNNIYSIIDFSNENFSSSCTSRSEEIYANFNKKHINWQEHQVTLV